MNLALTLSAATLIALGGPAAAQRSDTPRSHSPFGIASGAEWSGDYPRFQPMLRDAGVRWLRMFPEWQTLQPKQGEWDWKSADQLVATSKANGLQLTGILGYFAPWASVGNDTRTFPVKDMLHWRDYVAGVIGRYGKEIPYWEVWNEPQAFQKDGTPQQYADMVQAAYHSAKKANPDVKLGLTSANFAVSYLNMVLTRGAADHFDYLCVHPYENMDQLLRPGGEVYFLSMAGNLRRMLAAHQQRADLPLWITEIGWKAPLKANAAKDVQQAVLLVKAYVLSLAQGFERVFWFEARGPAYGEGMDHGILRQDWSPRPAYTAMKTMTSALGETPEYVGWVDLEGSYGFVFKNGEGHVLVAWSPVGTVRTVKFEHQITRIRLDGSKAPDTDVELGDEPLFMSPVPARILKEAGENRAKAFPWGGDFSNVAEVTCDWSDGGKAQGIKSVSGPVPEKVEEDRSVRVQKGGGLNFRTHPSFASFGMQDLEIRIVARRAVNAQQAGFQLMTESLKTIHGYDRAGYWTIPEGDSWHEHVWRLNDANFVGTWGYNIGITEVSGDLLVKELTVRRVQGR